MYRVPCLSACISLACGSAQEMERRKYDTEAERDTLVPVLRDVSRQEYLKKREEGKLEELRQALEDEEALFAVRAPAPARSGRTCALARHCAPRRMHPTTGAGRNLHVQAERQIYIGFLRALFKTQKPAWRHAKGRSTVQSLRA